MHKMNDAGDAATDSAGNDRMKIDWVFTKKLWQSPPQDPRRHTAREINKAVGILKRFGVRLPLLVGSDGSVIGHFIVVSAARRLGIEQLPVVYADDLPSAERQALSLALNRLYELGDFPLL